MSWTTDEWEGFTLCLERWWKDPFDDSDRIAWKLAVDGLDPQTAAGALKLLLRRGETWRPSVAEFVAALEPVAPTFDEAWPVIQNAMRLLRPGEDGAAVVSQVRSLAGDQAAGWLASYGVWRLANEPVEDPSYGGVVVKRLRDHYSELVAEPAGRDRLVAALESPRSGRRELRQVDPLAVLGIGDA